jgi:hypothetical protein
VLRTHKRIINFAFMFLCSIGTSEPSHLPVLTLHGTVADTIALISTTLQFAVKDHVQRYIIMVVMYHDTNENSNNPTFRGRDFAIHFLSFVVSQYRFNQTCRTLCLCYIASSSKRLGNQYYNPPCHCSLHMGIVEHALASCM